jgi:4'-phosphopantetheinyl transferase
MRERESQVAIYLAAGARDLTALAAGEALLDASERARADRFVQGKDRILYCAAHVLLRLCLSRHAPLNPRDWRFAGALLARPEVDGGGWFCGQGLRFSLSHSHGLVCCAVSVNGPVGIDCEGHRPLPDALDLARRYFAAAESANLASMPPGNGPGQRLPLFYTYWTLKEAYLKATGNGLSTDLRSFAFRLAGERPMSIALTADPAGLAAPSDWAFALLRVGTVGTLAAALPAAGGALFWIHTVSPSGSPPEVTPVAASQNARLQKQPPLCELRFLPVPVESARG